MFRSILILAVVVFPNVLSAQQSNSTYCFFYRYTANVSTTEDKIWEDEMVLFIEEGNRATFESYTRYQRARAMQEAKAKGMSFQEFSNSTANLPSAKFNFSIQRDYTAQQSIYKDKIVKDRYRYTEPLEKPVWRVHSETKIIKGFNCQRATIDTLGRKFEAWFTEEIPLREGPYKFHGLPGLIVELYDQNQDHHFALTDSNYQCEYSPMGKDDMYLDVTRGQYLKALNNYYQNALDGMLAAGIEIGDAEFRKQANQDMRKIDNLIEMR